MEVKVKKLILILLLLLTACSVIKPTPAPLVEEKFTVNLPIVYNRYPKVVLAAYLEGIRKDDPDFKFAKPGGIIGTYITFSDLSWDRPDMAIGEIEKHGLQYTIQIKNAPVEWRVYPDKECSPPKPEYYTAYAQRVIEVLDRYDPYTISIWNEPEPAPEELGNGMDYYIGCWGDLNAEYFGGEEFGKFMAHIYPIIKEAHPNMTIVGGELMFSMYNDRHKKFATGFAKYGMFDRFSFHAYPGWPSSGLTSYPFIQANFARTLTDKPLELSETSYSCEDAWYDCSNPAVEKEQAVYLKNLLEKAYDNEIVFIRWYTLANNGWRNTDLVWKSVPKPAWYIYKEY